MKRYLYFAATLLAAGTMHAQQDLNSAADALRYSQDNITGTARFRAMSGAFGAVGGDVSAIMVNPAGAAIFNFNSGTASITSYNLSNTSEYFGSKTKKNDNAFDLNQLGAVFVFNNTKEGTFMNKFTLGFNYENAANLDNQTFTRGINPNNSVADYFLYNANGFPGSSPVTLGSLNSSFYEDLSYAHQQAFLGYNAYVIDPVDFDNPGNTSYIAAPEITNGNNFYQENAVATSGYNGKVALNFAAQLKERFYVGANVNVHFTDYIRTSSFYEDYNSGPNGLQWVEFNNEQYTYGGGISFDVGAIVKVTEQFRAGVAYQSPTWYRLQDEIRQNIASNCPECGGTSIVDTGITFIMDDYSIKTPSKWTGSLAYVFGKWGLLSVDGSLKDYSNTEYLNNRYNLINTELSDNLDMAAEIRAGGEVRIKNFSIRGGYRFEQSPYKNGSTIGDLWGASGGFGFAFGNSRLDLAYSYFQREMDAPMFEVGFTDASRITTKNNNITLSYTLDL